MPSHFTPKIRKIRWKAQEMTNTKFSKKHYEVLAKWLKNSKATAHEKELIAEELSTIFKADNSRFSYAKFYKANGVKAPI